MSNMSKATMYLLFPYKYQIMIIYPSRAMRNKNKG